MVVKEKNKNHSGGHKQKEQDYSDVRMYEMKQDILDPVKAFEFYILKLHPENPHLFQKPKKNQSINQSTVCMVYLRSRL